MCGVIIAGVLISFNIAKKRFLARPTDAQMDQWLEENLKELSKASLIKMDIDSSSCIDIPVTVTGPRLWDKADAKLLYRKGNDNQIRFTPINATIITFTEKQLLAYNCVLDFTTGRALNESTDEYFYKDVVSVSTKTESKTIKLDDCEQTLQLNAAETFTLTTSGGTSISVLLRDPELAKFMGGGEIKISNAEKTIQVIRKILREKKSA